MDRRSVLASRTLIAIVLLSAIMVGVAALNTTQAGPPCRCPLIVAQVMCDNGKVYINQCFANCAHARNCVPYGN